MKDVPQCFYRISIKALVLNENKDKFLVVKEETGKWELPGGGLEWGANIIEDLKREILEEMGLQVKNVLDNPSYFLTFKDKNNVWKANVLYRTELENIDFTPSEECVEIQFVNKYDVEDMELLPNVEKFLEMFEVESNH